MVKSVSNKLIIKGDKVMIKKIIGKTCENFAFSNTIDQLENNKNNYNEWKLNNWGTMFNPYNVKFYRKKFGYIITFITTNTPPNSWIKFTSILFPKLHFTNYWAFVNQNFPECGKILVQNGDFQIINFNELYEIDRIKKASKFVKKHFILIYKSNKNIQNQRENLIKANEYFKIKFPNYELEEGIISENQIITFSINFINGPSDLSIINEINEIYEILYNAKCALKKYKILTYIDNQELVLVEK